jgi:aryl-alcohol dehydrogenase-like predicted oxidoreductase
MHEILQAIGDCVEAGKIRHFGLSDDTTWGIHTYLNLSQKFALPRVVSIQNEFNMLHTKDWPYLIEHCVLENIAYLPWSPLAAGVLSGKYLNGQIPEGSRWSFSQRNGLFRDTPSVHAATAELKTLAEKYGMSLATMALAWCKQVDGVSSSIIGATSLVQLEENIAAFDVELSEELLSDIKTLLKLHASPF